MEGCVGAVSLLIMWITLCGWLFCGALGCTGLVFMWGWPKDPELQHVPFLSVIIGPAAIWACILGAIRAK